LSLSSARQPDKSTGNSSTTCFIIPPCSALGVPLRY
jgi:hypothetical protein